MAHEYMGPMESMGPYHTWFGWIGKACHPDTITASRPASDAPAVTRCSQATLYPLANQTERSWGASEQGVLFEKTGQPGDIHLLALQSLIAIVHDGY